jgi:hypothetical protein
MRWKQRKIPTTALCSSNIDTSLHSQGKHESSSHLYDAMCKYDQSQKLGWQQYTVQPTQTPHTKFYTLFLRANRNTTWIHQTMYWIIREYLFVYILLQIITHKQVVTEIEEVGSVMEGTVYARDYIFFMEK